MERSLQASTAETGCPMATTVWRASSPGRKGRAQRELSGWRTTARAETRRWSQEPGWRGSTTVVAGAGTEGVDNGGGVAGDDIGMGGVGSVGGGAGGGVVALAGFFSIFLQGFFYTDFIWLENLTRRRKRGIGDEGRGPAHLSCRRRGRRGGQGTGGGGRKRGLLGGERRNHTRRLYPQNAWSIPSARATLNLDERYREKFLKYLMQGIQNLHS